MFGGWSGMNEQFGEEALGTGSNTDLMRLRNMGARATDVQFWKKARVVLPGTKRI